MSDPVYDIAVIGGGLIGAAAALGAARQGQRVLLLDRAQPQPILGRFGMDIRNVSLSPGSRALLEQLGVWGKFCGAPFVGMQVWEEQGTATLSFDAAEVDRSELGWIVENSHLVDALWQALQQASNVDIRTGEVLEAISAAPGLVDLRSATTSYQTRLLIGTDGAASSVRRLLGVETSTYPTGHTALVTLLETQQPHLGIARQRFLLDGPLALLPSMAAKRVSVVWSQSEPQAQRRLQLSDAAFCREITAASDNQLGEVLAVDERYSFPLNQHLVHSFNPLPRVLLMGDAARVLHPLAGLGANVGFEDVRDFVTRLAQLPAGVDPGYRGIWSSFARQRRARAQVMLSLMTLLRRTYAQNDPYLQWLRSLGVRLTTRFEPLKKQVIREALGLGPLAQPL